LEESMRFVEAEPCDGLHETGAAASIVLRENAATKSQRIG
jgi:hypothetical protein